MIKSAFLNVVDDPSKIAALSSDELREVLHEFPYFSAAHLLLAKKLKVTESLQFEKQLNITAAYVPSRKVLYDLIHAPDLGVAHVEEHSLLEVIHTPKQEFPVEPVEPVVDELDQLIQSESAAYSLDYKVEEVEAPKEVEKPIDERHHFSDWLNYFEEEKTAELSQQEIIDQFISDEAHIRIKPDSELPTENLARKSAKDLEDYMVTETLAKIHLDQGNRMKAIEIYERLMLKYPEKRTYFAAQIEFLKQK